MTCNICGGPLLGSSCLRCAPPQHARILVSMERLALLEGQARDSAAQLKRLPELAAEVDRLHSQLIDMQRRLQALESVEAMIQRGVEAFCTTLEAK